MKSFIVYLYTRVLACVAYNVCCVLITAEESLLMTQAKAE
ncbi:hypothetical protein FLA_3490 [Filimonas lacunae]|nr:hypothetical protein FLA_3490 [Filimonas lacunae]